MSLQVPQSSPEVIRSFLVPVQFNSFGPSFQVVRHGAFSHGDRLRSSCLYWQWEKNKEYAECYNLAETDEKIEIRNQRDKSGKFSISTAQHDMLRTLDGYDDSGD